MYAGYIDEVGLTNVNNIPLETFLRVLDGSIDAKTNNN